MKQTSEITWTNTKYQFVLCWLFNIEIYYLDWCIEILYECVCICPVFHSIFFLHSFIFVCVILCWSYSLSVYFFSICCAQLMSANFWCFMRYAPNLCKIHCNENDMNWICRQFFMYLLGESMLFFALVVVSKNFISINNAIVTKMGQKYVIFQKKTKRNCKRDEIVNVSIKSSQTEIFTFDRNDFFCQFSRMTIINSPMFISHISFSNFVKIIVIQFSITICMVFNDSYNNINIH